MSAYNMWSFFERSNDGPFCEDDQFLFELFLPTMDEVIKKYEITRDPEVLVPADDDLADRVWQAAVEFFLEVGVLNVHTHRRIVVDASELDEVLYHTPESYVVGDGQDTRIWRGRRPEDTGTPFCIFSPDITCDEELFLPMSISYLQEPLADGVCAPILEESMGLKIRSGTPTELAGCIEHAMTLRQAARLVGRPGALPGGGGDRPVRHRSDRGQRRQLGRAPLGWEVDRCAHRVQNRQ